MASLNMASINTLFRKGYLFAGVIIAANMFVVNEVKASTIINNPGNDQPPQSEEEKQENPDASGTQYVQLFLNKVLSWEGRINFFGGLFFSVVNNYLKWCDYNPGGYWNLRIGCLELRSKRFLNGMLQFEGNLNLGRGAFWLIMTCLGSFKYFKGQISQQELTSTAAVIMNSWGLDINKGLVTYCLFFFLLSFQGFVSIPLTLHIPKINLSISISLDSIIWGVAGWILEKKKEVPIDHDPSKEIQNNEEDKSDDNKENNELKEQTDEDK